jgi:hypothetical protein
MTDKMDEFQLNEAAVSDGEDVLEMLHEIGPGAYGFSNDAIHLLLSSSSAGLKSKSTIHMESVLKASWCRKPLFGFEGMAIL